MSGIRRLHVISRPTVVWWWDRDRDTDVPRLHAVRWLEIDGPRDGLIRVVARECDPEDPDDAMIQMELQLQNAIHFSGPIEVDHASRHLDELDPLTRISACSHRIIRRPFDTQLNQYRGGVIAERHGQAIDFTVIIADNLTALEEDNLAVWAYAMIRTFQIEGPARWTTKAEDRWQILSRRPSSIHQEDPGS